MARWWRENYDATKHSNKMEGSVGGRYPYNVDEAPPDPLIEKYVYFVEVCQFTFQFLSLCHLEIAAEYFEKKHRGSTRIPGGLKGADHWEVQSWFHRLPKGLERKERRAEIAATLRSALADFRKL